jgi:N-acetylneuraminic acid mutarotase
MKTVLVLSFLFLFSLSALCQITIDYSNFDFASLNGWNLVNGMQTNKWQIGGAASYYNAFSRVGVYISSDNGTTHEYQNNSSSIVHVYKDFFIGSVTNDMLLTFKLSCNGESSKDYFNVYIMPSTITPLAGVELDPQYKVGHEEYSGFDFWRGFKVGIDRSDYTDNWFRIAFSWKNDNNGIGNSPAAIDNIRLSELNLNFDNWTQKFSAPPRYYGGSLSTGSSVITLGGDYSGSGNGTTQVREFDIPGNTWFDMPGLPEAVRLNESIKFNGNILSIGGFNDNSPEPTDEVYKFDLKNFNWSLGAAFPEKIFYHRLGLKDWNTLYCVGGSDETNNLLNSVYFLEEGSNKWEEATPLPGEGRADGAFTILNILSILSSYYAAVYIGGFTNSADSPLQVDSVFVGVIDPTNPANITWETRSNFPGGPRARLRAFQWGQNTLMVVGGATGQDFSVLFNDVWLYNVLEDQWTQLGNFPLNICAYYGGTERLTDNIWSAVITGGVKTGPLISDLTYAIYDTLAAVTSVETIDNSVPEKFILSQNYPNPFNPSTTIEFAIPEQSFVRLEVFNTLGEKITTLVQEELNAGNYKHDWNSKNLPCGVYIYRLITTNHSETKKMLLLK